MESLTQELCRRFGKEKGEKLLQTIMPGIMGDFNKMLMGVKVGVTVKEEYHIDDGSGTVVVEGERLGNGNLSVRAHLV